MRAAFFSINALTARWFIFAPVRNNKRKHEQTMKRKIWLNLGMLAALAALAAGCTTWGMHERHRANSLYNYLYSGKPGHVDAESIPVLALPLRVGIAFVPADSFRGDGGYFPSVDATLSENEKMDLMQHISAQFKSYPFVKSMELIPTAYLTPKGGFANLEQIRTMYGVDVMVLLSYDQVQFTDQGMLSLSYWTIVGAYFIQGEKNDTQTMLDGAVYDIASHKLLFRAPGVSKVKGSATYVNLSQQLRKDSEQGFQEAATNLVASLKVQLEEFQQRVKSAPAEFKVVKQPGYTGAAAFSGVEVVLACGMGACYLWTRRNRRY
jgi:rhombotail lipoprotein